VQCWFSRVHRTQLPDEICFAHLDGDLYTSIRDSLKVVYPRLVPGAACIIDDYGWDGLTGVKVAVDEYMADKPEKVRPLATGNPKGFQAVIIKI
jgi:O-methyltransferase